MRKKMLLCDLVIAEDICNASCMYCLTNYDQFHDHKKQMLRREYRYEKGTELYRRVNKLLDTLEDNLEVAALKISGGEILMVENIIQLLEERSAHYLQLQLMTNGIMLNPQIIERLHRIPNLFMQISCDSNTLEGNYYRNQNQEIQSRLLRNIDATIKAGIPLEINTVLTDRSLPSFRKFLEYLLRYKDWQLKVFPFPVRGDARASCFPREDQIDALKQVLYDYDRYRMLLPPRLYIENLIAFLQHGTRQHPCTIPYHTAQLFDDGLITPCPFWWSTSLGNIDKQGVAAIEQYRTNPIYRLLLSKNIKFKPCQHCYVRSEVMNLYFEDKLSDSELKTVPFYRSDKMIDFINYIKLEYQLRTKDNSGNLVCK